MRFSAVAVVLILGVGSEALGLQNLVVKLFKSSSEVVTGCPLFRSHPSLYSHCVFLLVHSGHGHRHFRSCRPLGTSRTDIVITSWYCAPALGPSISKAIITSVAKHDSRLMSHPSLFIYAPRKRLRL